MSTPAALFVRIDDAVRGPFTPDQLRSLVEVGAITPETAAAADAAGPWAPLRELPAADGLFPKPVQFQFKARSFEPVNRAGETPVDHRALIAAANRPPAAAAAGPASAPAATPNEVFDLLRENRAREHAAGLDDLAPLPPRPNRRRCDFLILLIGGNLLFLTGFLTAPRNVVTVLFAFSGAVFYTASLVWVMYGVMSRY
jgi:hypothetical protein